MGLWGLYGASLRQFQTKIAWCSENGVAGQLRSGPSQIQMSGSRPKCKGASQGMDPWPPGVKLGSEMGTHPGEGSYACILAVW